MILWSIEVLTHLKILLMTPHLDWLSTTDPTPEMLSVVKTRNRMQHDERNVCSTEHAHMLKKDNILEKDN